MPFSSVADGASLDTKRTLTTRLRSNHTLQRRRWGQQYIRLICARLALAHASSLNRLNGQAKKRWFLLQKWLRGHCVWCLVSSGRQCMTFPFFPLFLSLLSILFFVTETVIANRMAVTVLWSMTHSLIKSSKCLRWSVWCRTEDCDKTLNWIDSICVLLWIVFFCFALRLIWFVILLLSLSTYKTQTQNSCLCWFDCGAHEWNKRKCQCHANVSNRKPTTRYVF